MEAPVITAIVFHTLPMSLSFHSFTPSVMLTRPHLWRWKSGFDCWRQCYGRVYDCFFPRVFSFQMEPFMEFPSKGLLSRDTPLEGTICLATFSSEVCRLTSILMSSDWYTHIHLNWFQKSGGFRGVGDSSHQHGW